MLGATTPSIRAVFLVFLVALALNGEQHNPNVAWYMPWYMPTQSMLHTSQIAAQLALQAWVLLLSLMPSVGSPCSRPTLRAR